MHKPSSIPIIDDEEELSTLFKDFAKAIGMDAESFTNPLLAYEHFKDNGNKYSLNYGLHNARYVRIGVS